MTEEENRRPWIRFRLKTVLLVVAFLALVTAVVIQQVQIARMRQMINAREAQVAKERDQLTTIIREMRGYVERQAKQGR